MNAVPSIQPLARVDSKVLESAELQHRLEEALSRVSAVTGVGSIDLSTSRLDVRAECLHHLWLTMAPTYASPRPGLRGKVVFRMHRLIRRLTYWYVEPRMEAQREIDAELARFATDTSLALDSALREIERLGRLTDRLQRQISVPFHQNDQFPHEGTTT